MYSSTLPSTSALDGGGWSTSRPGRFTPEKDPVPIVQEAGWASGPVWTNAENLSPTGIRSPDRPARSESLYRLRYIQLYIFIFEIFHLFLDETKALKFKNVNINYRVSTNNYYYYYYYYRCYY
jgi:hypothetical protein